MFCVTYDPEVIGSNLAKVVMLLKPTDHFTLTSISTKSD